jgi:predicted enzyme related to lactoylglutathione lyase
MARYYGNTWHHLRRAVRYGCAMAGHPSPGGRHPSGIEEAVMIQGVSKVVVSVADQERAKQFWTQRIGFAVTVDEPYGDHGRWIEVVPPDKGVVLVLSPRQPGEQLPEIPEMMPHSPVLFACDDIQQTYQELTSRGVRFPTAPTKMPFGWWSLFEDDDGTRYALEQRP